MSWTATDSGLLGLDSTEVIAVSPGLGTIVFGADAGVPAAAGEQSVGLDCPFGYNEVGPWLFLVRAKDNYDVYNRSHENRYAQLKGVYQHPGVVAYQDDSLESEAADITASMLGDLGYSLIDGTDLVPPSTAASAMEDAVVFYAVVHGNIDAHGTIGFENSVCMVGDDGQTPPTVGIAGRQAPRLKLAVFYACWSAADNPTWGSLLEEAVGIGADCAIGWTVVMLGGEVADNFGEVFWQELLDGQEDVADAAQTAVDSCKSQFDYSPDPKQQDLLAMHNFLCEGQLNGGDLLW